MRKVIVNTTPLIALSHVGQLDLLHYKGIFLKENFREVSFFYYGQSSLWHLPHAENCPGFLT